MNKPVIHPTEGGKYRIRTRLAGKRVQRTFDDLRLAEHWVATLTGEADKPLAAGTVSPPDVNRERLQGTRFVFSSAQNNTYVHAGFLKALESYCTHNNAQLIVSPFTYNKNGFQNDTKDDADLWYDPAVVPHMRKTSLEVTGDLVFCGELDILPTAVSPLSGLENYAGAASGIVPHAKVQMISLPRMKGDPPRFMYTTGAVTQRNYIQRKAGQKAEFHHVFGALVVELNESGEWFARQLVADSTGLFHDLDKAYHPDGSVRLAAVSAIHWGDIHAECIDTVVLEGMDNMIDALQPGVQFFHDVTDFRARNHHSINDPYDAAYKYYHLQDSVERGMRQTANVLMQLRRDYCKSVIVDSNHDQAFMRWLKDPAGMRDPANAYYWHIWNARIHEHIASESEERLPHVFEEAVRKHISGGQASYHFLREDESYKVHGIECGMHGHRGPNGSRGASKAFANLGVKVNVGHAHSASIYNGVYTAGTSSELDMGYNKGPSSWSHSHILIYANGKRSIVTMRGKKWRV